MRVLVTGGCGFIGSNLVRYLLAQDNVEVINVDKLTYAGNKATLSDVESDSQYKFIEGDICNVDLIEKVIKDTQPDSVMHLAAESHVDRSISGPSSFIQTNIIGTYNLLEASRNYYGSLPTNRKTDFKFLHVSTDEVYGDLLPNDPKFSEQTPYDPSSPYSASKASSDHLVRAWQRTFNLPTLITNCSNNYGPYQLPEKLIPLVINNALEEKEIPIYGNGLQIRDWLYVEDHVKALFCVLTKGEKGHTYNIGGKNEHRNIDIVKRICALLNQIVPLQNRLYEDQITFVADRPGHDLRYAIDPSKIENDLNWFPYETFETGLQKTVEWYIANKNWTKASLEKA